MNLNNYYSGSEKYYDCEEYTTNTRYIDYDNYNYNLINNQYETSLLKDHENFLSYTSKTHKFNILKIHYNESCYHKKERGNLNNICSHQLFIEYPNEVKSVILNGLEVYQMLKEHNIQDMSIDQHLIDQYQDMLAKIKEKAKYRTTFRYRIRESINKFLKTFCCYVPKYIRLDDIEMQESTL